MGFDNDSVFSYVKTRVSLIDYVESLPNTKGLKKASNGTYRCNNVIAGGSNASAMLLDETTGTFRCFSHGQEFGDVITLHQILQGFDSMYEAAEDVAELYNIDIPDELLLRSGGGVKKNLLFAAMNTIRDTAYHMLIDEETEEATIALDYLYDRGMTDEEIDTWKIGFLPYSQQQAKDIILDACDGNEKIAKVVGMMNERGDIPMRGRVLLPIMNRTGNTQSFSARRVEGISCSVPDSKYINTKTTPIFDKSSSLYGAHLLNGKRKVVVCEGNLDAIGMTSITQDDVVAVAVCGTAFGTNHSPLISMVDNLTVMFDGDEAGKKAALKTLWSLNYVPKVSLCLLDGEDPWDVSRKGKDAARIALKKTVSLIPGLVAVASSLFDQNALLSWVASSYQQLNYLDPQTALLQSVSNHTGMSVPVIEARMSSKGVRSHIRKTDSNPEGWGEETLALLRCLWSLPPDIRTSFFGSLDDEWLSFWFGIDDDREMAACDATIFGLSSRAGDVLEISQSLAPNNDAMDPSIVAFSAMLARKILDHYNAHLDLIDDTAFTMLQPLNVIAGSQSGADPTEQLLYTLQASTMIYA